MYVLSAISLMSAPAAKALSLPVRMMAAIAGSPSNSSSAAPRSAISAAFNAFNACGRLRVTMPTGPRRSRRMLANSVLLIYATSYRHRAMVDMMPSFPHAVAAPSLVALGDGGNHGEGTKTQQSRGKEAEIHQEETGARPFDDHDRGAQEAMTGRLRCRSLVPRRPPARKAKAA